jgi:hypothetical protein
MRYSPDLPLEEQQRLDQMHLGMQGGTRTGLDSMFNNAGRLQEYQSQPMVAAPPIISMTPRQEYEQAKLDAEQYRKDSGDMGRYVMDAERPFEEWRKNRPQGLGTNLTSLIAQPITSLPRPDVIGPAVMRPAVMPQPEVFKPIGRRGGNFLNRFERLLDGLEGLVGKLGGESKPDPSPLVDPVGGIGSISPTPTPFTASQDY